MRFSSFSTSPDATAFVEVLSNLNTSVCRISIASRAIPTLDVENVHVQGGNIFIQPVKISPSPSIQVTLPLELDQRASSSRILADEESGALKESRQVLEVSGPILSTSSLFRNPWERHKTAEQSPFWLLPGSSAEELLDLQDIQCGSCGISLLESRSASAPIRFDRTLDLPTEHWHELVDCWTCHKEDYSRLQSGHHGTIIPSKRSGELLVARGYLVLHRDDIAWGRLGVDVDRNGISQKNHHQGCDHDQDHHPHHHHTPLESSWKALRCVQCSCRVGDVFQSEKDLKFATRLFKHSVGMQIGGRLVRRSPVGFFIEEVMEAISANASYKFFVHVEGDKRPAMLLWILNWNCQLSGDEVTNTFGSKTDVFIQAIRVAYIDTTMGDLKFERCVEEWNRNKQIERLDVSSTVFTELSAIMRLSLALTIRPRMMGEFRAAYILSIDN
ncbi:ubiquitin-conjugating enzyme E2-binding protein, partial [Zopfochytrium polystomum]